MFYLLKGFVLGILIAMPVGPITLLCIRRTLAHGRLSGLLSGLGVATADGAYGLVAALGLTAISGFLLKGQIFLGIAGGLFMCYLGLKAFRSKPAHDAAVAKDRGGLRDYSSALALTITNPMTILMFLGIFAGLGIHSGNYLDSSLLVVGVFLGSAVWWVALAYVIGLIRHRISDVAMLWLDRVSGSLILGFGVISVLKSVV